ncbi:MAG: MmgE/PrpD family protein [Gemmatimonas sp.]
MAKPEEHTSDSPSTVQTIAHWALGIRSSDLPAPCIAQAKLLLLDSIGCAIAGAEESVCQGIIAVCEDIGGRGPCTVIGRSRAVDMPHAILANGALVRVLDLSDYVVGSGRNGPEIGGHPSDNIPVALAAGEARRRSGLDILGAIAVGYELYGRFKGLMDRKGPWDGVSLSGFVAPVIAGRLMGLDQDQLAHALALSGARCATPAVVRRGGISAAKSIANAMVAQSAVEATLLAERGVTGPLAILDHERGVRSVFPNGDLQATFAAPFPTDSYIMRSNVKAYPCLATGQAAVAAALKLHGALAGRLDEIRRIEVVMAEYPFIGEQQEDPGRIHPQSRESADHSFHFLVAVALADGAFGTAQFEGARWRDPAIVALMERITMRRDATLNTRAPGTYPCAVRAVDAAGQEHVAEVLFPPGYSRDGISEADVVAKFHSVAEELHRGRRERIVEAVLGLDRATNVDALGAALRG